jgi:hypothetical protein
MSLSATHVYQVLRKYTGREATKLIAKASGLPTRRLQSWTNKEECCLKLSQIQLAGLLADMEASPSGRKAKPYERGNMTVAPFLPTPAANPSPPLPTGVADEYFKCASSETIDSCVVDFIERTSNAAITQATCASCARLLFTRELEEMALNEIPNSHNLRPHQPHPGHHLTPGGLLLAGGPYEEQASIHLCTECVNRLKSDRRPKMSLANGLWVGNIPPELQNLTLPERVLLALYFPVAYVVKLYPCGRRTYNTSQDRLHSALKGNVSTYKLDQQQIADMLGLTMPPPARILSSTIAITYVGPNNLPKRSLHGSFRVRRARVSRALYWLKANNPLYSNIKISEERLLQLPENGVPAAVEDTARWSVDVGALDQEHGSYVPLLEDEDEEGVSSDTLFTSPLQMSWSDQLEKVADDDDMLVDDLNPEHINEQEGVSSHWLTNILVH